MSSTADMIASVRGYRSAGGNRLYTQGFRVRQRDLAELRRLGVALDCAPPEVMSTAVELLVALDAHDRDRLLWIRETVATPHCDPWADTTGERAGPCFARLGPESLAALTACSRGRGVCLDTAAIAAVNTVAAVHRFVREGFALSLAEPVRLAATTRLRTRLSYSAA